MFQPAAGRNHENHDLGPTPKRLGNRGRAADNFVEKLKKVGEKAEEVGGDIADGAEDAYLSTKEAVQDTAE
jgi:heme oxygenase